MEVLAGTIIMVTTMSMVAGADGFATLDNNYDGIRTIVDSGGTGDTLDASGVTATGSIINLTPGTYSSINYYATQADKINAVVTNGSQAAKDWFTAQLDKFGCACFCQ